MAISLAYTLSLQSLGKKNREKTLVSQPSGRRRRPENFSVFLAKFLKQMVQNLGTLANSGKKTLFRNHRKQGFFPLRDCSDYVVFRLSHTFKMVYV